MIPKFNQEAGERRENNKKVGERRENNHCRNCWGKFFFFPTISVMPLPKLWGKKKIFFFLHNFGNGYSLSSLLLFCYSLSSLLLLVEFR